MHPRAFALYGGIFMLVFGLVALIPSMVGSAASLPPLDLEASYGLFLGTFPMNIVNKLALIAFGAAGIFASRVPGRELPASILWSRIVLVVMGVGAILGLFPQTNTFFGYWPLFGNEVGFHALFAVLGGYFGFALSSKVDADRVGPHPTRESLAH